MNATPKTLTVTESHQLLNALIPNNGTEKQSLKGIRNYAMALLMLDAGLRVGEVVALTKADLFYNFVPVENLVVRSEIAKNKKERIIPLSSRVQNALKILWHKYRFFTEAQIESPAFRTQKQFKPLTTRQVERIIRNAAMNSIGRPIHPHVLRHTFASRLMRKTNARIVMELLGHSQMSSTQIYTHPNNDDLKKAIKEICDDPQKEHLMTTDSSLDSHASNSADTPRTNHDHR